MINLLSTTSRIEAPFITITIGGYTFGKYTNSVERVVDENGFSKSVLEDFPNVVNTLEVEKVNGSVNNYTIGLVYAIREGNDPNKIDKILSSASKDRKIIISYGDYSNPQFIYRKEEAIISNVTSNVNVHSSSIIYTIRAVSSSVLASAGMYSFPKRTAKPSDVIKEILYDNTYGLLDIFYGMRDKKLVSQQGLIMSDDKSVVIEAKVNISILEYLDYLVSCMTSVGDVYTSMTSQTKYIFTTVDDVTGVFGGPYFRITKIGNNVTNTDSLTTYEIDIGYPTANIVTSFSTNTNDAYTLLYDYSEKIHPDNYEYRLNDQGEFEYIYAPKVIRNDLYRPTQADINWWSKVTQFPISATVTLKGLLRPAILMSYVRLNVFFYGRKHNSSGLYIITKQVDNISASGYRTTLSLTRIKGDSTLQ